MTEILHKIREYKNDRNKYSSKEREQIRRDFKKSLNRISDNFIGLIDYLNTED